MRTSTGETPVFTGRTNGNSYSSLQIRHSRLQRSSFSMNQCRFITNISADIAQYCHPMEQPTSTHIMSRLQTAFLQGSSLPLSSHQLSLMILIISFMVMWRWKRKGEKLDLGQSEQTTIVPDVVNTEGEHELHADPILPRNCTVSLMAPWRRMPPLYGENVKDQHLFRVFAVFLAIASVEKG